MKKTTVSEMLLLYLFVIYFLICPATQAAPVAIAQSEVALDWGGIVVTTPGGVTLTRNQFDPPYNLSYVSGGGVYDYNNGILTAYASETAISGGITIDEYASHITGNWKGGSALLTGGQSGTGFVTVSIPYTLSASLSVSGMDQSSGQASAYFNEGIRGDVIYYSDGGNVRATPFYATDQTFLYVPPIEYHEGVTDYYWEQIKPGNLEFVFPYYNTTSGQGRIRFDFDLVASNVAFVPEPTTMLLLGLGLVGLAGVRRKFKQ